MSTEPRRGRLSLDDYALGVRAGDRAVLGRAITLIESQRADDQALAQALVERLTAEGAGAGAHRVGITGVPGAGKSTLIEALGVHLCAAGRRVAVLAVDPSSERSGGSILGDKTRMEALAREPRAFIRPSPSLGALGGVARHTRESALLCEAAGYDVILIETVGVGQSEVMVAHLVDCFVLVMIPGAGDELQGIKRGILEIADVVIVNKADGDNVEAAKRARRDYAHALHLMQPRIAGWAPPTLLGSARTGAGIPELWQTLLEHRRALEAAGAWVSTRADQQLYWMWRAIEDGLRRALADHPGVQARLRALEDAVRERRLSPDHAAAEVIQIFRGG